MTHLIFFGVAAALMLPALWFAFIPMIPVLPYLFAVALIFGFFDGFSHLTGTNLIILGALVVISFLIDHLSGIIGAKYGGASRRALVGGILGLILGTVIAPPLGGLAGLFLGVLFVELYNKRHRTAALRAAVGSLLGSLAGTAVNIFLVLIFMVLFSVFALG